MSREKSLLLLILVLIILCALTACDNRPMDQREYSKQSLKGIPELEDCTYINLDSIKIIRCPNSSTSAQWQQQHGKTQSTERSVTIDQP